MTGPVTEQQGAPGGPGTDPVLQEPAPVGWPEPVRTGGGEVGWPGELPP